MDSGDRPDNRLTAEDTRFGGFRNQSFSNLFQGFFGVKPVPTSVGDIPSSEPTKASEESSAGNTVAPSSDDSWILSHFLGGKHERENDGNLRRNVTWSEFGKFDHPHSAKPASSKTDVSRADNELSPHYEISSIPLVEELATKSMSPANDRTDVLEKPILFVSKHIEHQHNSKPILSSFLMHDMPLDALKPRQDVTSLDRTGSLDRRARKKSISVVSSGSNPDLVDRGDFPLVTASSEKLAESKHTLRDFLWSFNHEKINFTKKEMNLIASIDL